jgi:hypothetical protein
LAVEPTVQITIALVSARTDCSNPVEGLGRRTVAAKRVKSNLGMMVRGTNRVKEYPGAARIALLPTSVKVTRVLLDRIAATIVDGQYVIVDAPRGIIGNVELEKLTLFPYKIVVLG